MSFRDNPFLSKELGPMTLGQLGAIVLAIVLGTALLCIDGTAKQPLMWIIVAAILYLFPHFLGAGPKLKACYPLVFAVIAIVIGSCAVAPAYVDEHSSEHLTGNGLSVDIVPSDDSLTVTAFYSGSEPRTADMVVAYCEINYIAFRSEQLSEGIDGLTLVNISDGVPQTVPMDGSKLYYLLVGYTDSDGKLDPDTMSNATLTGFQYGGNDRELLGSAIAVLAVLIIFYLILVLSTLMRRRLSSTRQKMEAQGRLYPQGYGRCNFCGAIVLPGQINCSKCGAYIDRPESMKPHKKDYFVCGNCGCEVSSGMTECPKCGAKFDSEENVVIHKDGTADVSSTSVACENCGKTIPSNSKRCPYCGHERKRPQIEE